MLDLFKREQGLFPNGGRLQSIIFKKNKMSKMTDLVKKWRGKGIAL